VIEIRSDPRDPAERAEHKRTSLLVVDASIKSRAR
jgi:hypothetical protein